MALGDLANEGEAQPPAASALAPALRPEERLENARPERLGDTRAAIVNGQTDNSRPATRQTRQFELHRRRPVLEGVVDQIADQAAQQAVRKWTFAPATKDGVPVPFDFRMNFSFALQ